MRLSARRFETNAKVRILELDASLSLLRTAAISARVASRPVTILVVKKTVTWQARGAASSARTSRARPCPPQPPAATAAASPATAAPRISSAT